MPPPTERTQADGRARTHLRHHAARRRAGPGHQPQRRAKLEIAEQLARLDVDIIEAGFPIASPGDFDGVRGVAEQVKGPMIAALARTVTGDIERAAEALKGAER